MGEKAVERVKFSMWKCSKRRKCVTEVKTTSLKRWDNLHIEQKKEGSGRNM